MKYNYISIRQGRLDSLSGKFRTKKAQIKNNLICIDM